MKKVEKGDIGCGATVGCRRKVAYHRVYHKLSLQRRRIIFGHSIVNEAASSVKRRRRRRTQLEERGASILKLLFLRMFCSQGINPKKFRRTLKCLRDVAY